MKSPVVWIILVGVSLLLCGRVLAWNRQIFDRYSRNLFQNGELAAATQNDLNDFTPPFRIGPAAGAGAEVGRDGNIRMGVKAGNGFRQQVQPEVYGIVEPLIEDLPCVDRPCSVDEDCCPSGVCMLGYGGVGKCYYDYGHSMDLCRRHADCEPGLSCLKGAAGNFYCQPTPMLSPATKSLAKKQFGEDCVTSGDCNVNKFMCCQLQRTHHRVLPRKQCAFFRDPLLCIDTSQPEDEATQESRFLTSFSQRLM